MESSSATTPTPEELKARKAAELRGAPFLVYRDDKGEQKLVELDENARHADRRAALRGRHRAAVGP